MTTPGYETAVPEDIAYLDRLAATDEVGDYRRRALAALRLAPGHTVLDLGCGPGTAFDALARRVTPGGRVIGIDHDPRMVREARRRAAGAAGIEALAADVHRLPLPDRSMDRARTDRVLQHVADPRQALAEARRVLRPGGLLVAAEPDWETLAIDHPDVDIARAYTRHLVDHVVRNAVLGRQLHRLARESGFDVPEVIPITPALRDVRAADRILGLWRTTRRAVVAGRLTDAQAAGWLDHLATEPFLASVTLHVVVARVPADT
ncbi:methyltransferase domain-containing protein [Streptomyces hainanensis]|uniref:Methyltransferase domain-containing protein n=1 Tax=Streptomyces hainanensis TaxID=402648 RepID=A0A4R4SK84_9ACTN|nr:methyltransferase domain-containing protein [Streptomyces hainanensis]TDC64008.1 methyltransferase domain-containing protein [Streptomyces hainanensis]